MKTRLDYKSKRIAIIVIIAIILFAIASISTYFFIKGNDKTQAAELDSVAANNQNSAQEQRTEETTATSQTEETQTETTTTQPTEQVNNEQGTESTTQQANAQTTNVGVNPQLIATNTELQESTTTRTETQVTENTNMLLGFNQQTININSTSVFKLNGNMPNIKKEIVATTGSNLNGVLNGDEITYEIKINNENSDSLKQINASAIIPEGTELVEGSISDEGTLENGKILWKIDIDKEKTIKFTVKVIATEGIISANAVVEGKETEIVKTPILKAALTVDKAEVSKNETLTYTVSIENTADIPAEIKVEATIPENTQLETEELNVNDNTIRWEKTLSALEKVKYTYTVKVNKYKKEYAIENAVKVNGTETNKVSSKIIDIISPEIIVKKESKGKDPYFSEVSFKLHDNNLVDKIVINGTEKDLSDSEWSDANYQNIKSLLHEGENTIVLFDVAGNKTEKKFTIDWTAPKIQINGENKITLEAGIDTYEEKGATVTDNVDATIANLQPTYIHYSVDGKFVGKVDKVDTTKVGTYKVVYEYTDAAGNKGIDASDERHEYVIRLVTVQDTTKPLLKLNGDKKITLEAGIDTYKELGATMIDNVDATIANLQPTYIHYSVDGKFVGKVDKVDTTKLGTYKVVYEYTDKAGNKGVDALDLRHEYLMRTVIVKDTIAPTAEVSFETTEPTDKLFVTVKFSEKINEGTLPQGFYAVAGEANTYKKAYYSNKEHSFTVKDLAGNDGNVKFEITNIQ